MFDLCSITQLSLNQSNSGRSGQNPVLTSVCDSLRINLDDRGQFFSFQQKLEIPREVLVAKDGRFIKWSRALPLPPGLYQVRVAFRDRQTGRTGSAMAWVEVPPH
jgi:hypothetical protein